MSLDLDYQEASTFIQVLGTMVRAVDAAGRVLIYFTRWRWMQNKYSCKIGSTIRTNSSLRIVWGKRIRVMDDRGVSSKVWVVGRARRRSRMKL